MSTIINAKTSLGHNGYSLKTLELSVHFHGAVCVSDVPEHIPVHVSVRLPNWPGFLPVVHDSSKEKLAASKPLSLAMFPFLPLPAHFEPTTKCQWEQLSRQIEQCLVADPLLDSRHPECYRLMRELFWMAFVAAFPEFPHGNWPRWNGLIGMDGDFISHWVLKGEDELDVELLDTPHAIRLVIWEQFRSIISDLLFIPSTN